MRHLAIPRFVILFLFVVLVGQGITVRSSRAQTTKTEVSTLEIDPAAVERSGSGWKYPSAGWLVVHIEGAPYDRGFQHGRLLAREIVDMIKTISVSRGRQGSKDAWKQYRILVQAFFLHGFDAEYLEEMKGIADGAAAAGAKFDDRPIDLIDIVGVNAEIESSFLPESLQATPTGLDANKYPLPQVTAPKPPKQDRCSAFIATGPATRDGRIVMGHITMSSLPFVRHYNVWLDVQPARGHRFVMQTFPGGIQSGMDYYISASGLVVAETTIPQTRFRPVGQSIASRIRRVIQHAQSIDEAVQILESNNNGLYTNEWLIGDLKSNEIAMLELGTGQTRLWRSSKNEWFAGTVGFYWGCNNTKDRGVLADTVADLRGKPGNLVLHPHERDVKWLEKYRTYRGKIDADFGVESFTTPPLAGYPSCDAKVTTAAMAERLSTWALYGPPLGKTWEVASADRAADPDVVPLASHEWTLLRVDPPALAMIPEIADREPFPDEDDPPKAAFDQRHPFAWRGTLLPQTDADLWLAAAFSEYEKIISWEKALKREEDDDKLSTAARDRIDVAMFTQLSAWYAAARRAGRDTPLNQIQSDWNDENWYPIAVGKGVRLLSDLRAKLGAAVFDERMDEFGMRYAGCVVSTADFRAFLSESSGAAAEGILAAWLDRNEPPDAAQPVATGPESSADAKSASEAKTEATRSAGFSIYSFEAEPEKTLIVYGTSHDRAAQREAAQLLQKSAARRFHNYSIPIRSDREVTDDELKGHHLLLVGRPATNRVTEGCAANIPVKFTAQSFKVRDEVYANPGSSIIAAGTNPKNARYSVVVFAGLNAQSTWQCVQKLSPEEELAPQVAIYPAHRSPENLWVK